MGERKRLHLVVSARDKILSVALSFGCGYAALCPIFLTKGGPLVVLPRIEMPIDNEVKL